MDGSELTNMNEEDDLVGRFGFKQKVVLDMTLPSGEREGNDEYMMQFIDRNAMNKAGDGLVMDDIQLAENLDEASSDYECTLSDVINYLKKCGYPLENCFISFFSPIFSAYINCGLDPLPASIKISKEDFTPVLNVDGKGEE
jgi:hypothetical protein